MDATLSEHHEGLTQKAWREFVYGGHLGSLGAPAIAWSSAVLLQVPPSALMLLVAYLMAQIVYATDHWYGAHADGSSNPERAEHVRASLTNSPVAIALYASALAAALLWMANPRLDAYVLALALSGVAYSLGLKNVTRHVPFFKTGFVSLVWAAGVLIPAFYYRLPVATPVLASVFLFVFLRFVLDTAYFDLKDADSDREKGLKTLPVLVGKRVTLLCLLVVNVVSIAPVAFALNRGLFPSFAAVWLLVPLYGFVYLLAATRGSGKSLRFMSYVVVDGEALVCAAGLMLARLVVMR